jgi:hypothetical protein
MSRARIGVSIAAVVAALAAFPAANAAPIVASADLSSLTAGASYGPPAPAHFTEPGPATVPSGTAAPLFPGPSYGNIDSLLLVISGAIPSGDIITLTYGDLAPITFSLSDFVSTASAGFDSNINGIGNGAVNGVVFSTALHAGADVTGLPSGLATDEFLAMVTISQTIATQLRVDVFGDVDGRIINNAADSGALGVTSRSPAAGDSAVAVPEPASVGMLGIALLAFGFAAPYRRGVRRR